MAKQLPRPLAQGEYPFLRVASPVDADEPVVLDIYEDVYKKEFASEG